MTKVNLENMKELCDTGDIVSIVLRWDGESFTINDDPSFLIK